MSEIICPECNEEISSYAKACPHCGFPMDEYLKEHNLTDFNKTWICTKCAKAYYYTWFKTPICEYCKTPIIQTNIDNKIVSHKVANCTEDEYNEYIVNLAKEYGDNFEQETFNNRIKKMHENNKKIVEECSKSIEQKLNSTQPSLPQATCPYCHSTNTKKIGAGSRVKSTLMFGIFSKKNGKEWHCNECGSDF